MEKQKCKITNWKTYNKALNRRMCEVAERVIVVTDSSKFNLSSLHKIIDTQTIDVVITDEGIPVESLNGLRKLGIDVVLVNA